MIHEAPTADAATLALAVTDHANPPVEMFDLSKIDGWFLTQIKEIVDFEEELAGAKG